MVKRIASGGFVHLLPLIFLLVLVAGAVTAVVLLKNGTNLNSRASSCALRKVRFTGSGFRAGESVSAVGEYRDCNTGRLMKNVPLVGSTNANASGSANFAIFLPPQMNPSPNVPGSGPCGKDIKVKVTVTGVKSHYSVTKEFANEEIVCTGGGTDQVGDVPPAGGCTPGSCRDDQYCGTDGICHKASCSCTPGKAWICFPYVECGRGNLAVGTCASDCQSVVGCHCP